MPKPSDECPVLSGDAPIIGQLHDAIDQLAKSPCRANVLIIGETGTGKEVVARALHHKRHPQKLFLGLNCSLFQGDTFLAELFGHKKGTFTGAISENPGLIGTLTKSGGTLFLDELPDMPESSQPTLLRFLENHEYRQLGDNTVINVKNMPLVIAAGQRERMKVIRPDLLNRLAEVELYTPTLSENSPKGFEAIALELIQKIVKEAGGSRELIDKANSLLRELKFAEIAKHDWSGGNVRAFRNYLKKCLILGDSRLPTSERQNDLQLPLFAQIPRSIEEVKTVKEIKDSYINYVTENFKGLTMEDYAKWLGLSPPTMRKAIK